MPSIIDTLSSTLLRMQWIRFTNVAICILVLYDHLITLDLEMKYIWPQRWSIVKVMFFLIRYQSIPLGIFLLIGYIGTDPSYTFCRLWIQCQAYGTIITFCSSGVILQARIYAMYQCNKTILYLTSGCFVIATAVSISLLIVSIDHSGYKLVPVVIAQVCELGNAWKPTFTYLVPMLFSELLLFILAVWKGYRTLSDQSHVALNSRTLLRVLVTDSVFYFTATFSSYLASLLVWATDFEFVELVSVLSAVAPIILSTRLIFHVHETMDKRIPGSNSSVSTFHVFQLNQELHTMNH